MESQIAIYDLDHEYFVVAFTEAEFVFNLQPIVCVPNAPVFIEGMTNLRGKTLPVIDLHKYFGLPTRHTNKNCRLIVISVNDIDVGLIVDRVSKPLRCSEHSMESALPIAPAEKFRFISGFPNPGNNSIIFLDLNQVLSIYERGELATMKILAKCRGDNNE